MYCVLCTVYCVLCTVYCVLCTVYCVLCTVYCVLCTVYCVLCTVYCVLCTVYCVLCTVYCVLCTVYCVLCTVYLTIRLWSGRGFPGLRAGQVSFPRPSRATPPPSHQTQKKTPKVLFSAILGSSATPISLFQKKNSVLSVNSVWQQRGGDLRISATRTS